MCVVVNKRVQEYDVYIGRGSRWGNPFVMVNQTESERNRVVSEYRKYLWDQIKSGEVTKADLLQLDGKRLGCFCSPKLCHGDVIKLAVGWARK